MGRGPGQRGPGPESSHPGWLITSRLVLQLLLLLSRPKVGLGLKPFTREGSGAQEGLLETAAARDCLVVAAKKRKLGVKGQLGRGWGGGLAEGGLCLREM